MGISLVQTDGKLAPFVSVPGSLPVLELHEDRGSTQLFRIDDIRAKICTAKSSTAGPNKRESTWDVPGVGLRLVQWDISDVSVTKPGSGEKLYLSQGQVDSLTDGRVTLTATLWRDSILVHMAKSISITDV